ncbi:MAG: amidohydrolase [Deltaproteobacteria bacterium]|nr:amidohydrolase [Candidatus Zymogenaceae bacterium]
MTEIIDIHTHLGDILYDGGGELIDKKGVRKRMMLDLVSISEFLLHPDFGGAVYESPLFSLVAKASRARNDTATLENMKRNMDRYGIQMSACMPIPPYVTFDDLKRAAGKDKRIIPFTGVDFTREYDVDKALAQDVANGARGMKLHPIIQCISLDDPRVFCAVEAFGRHRLPILFHSGIAHYYPTHQKDRERPEFGAIEAAGKLVASFPEVRFIAGHAGLYQAGDVIKMLAREKNVSVDISVQSPKAVKRLLEAFGPERVLFASDWPWGCRKTPIQVVDRVCKGDDGVKRRVLSENARELLNLS